MYRGLYLNLDRSTRRRTALEAHLQAVGAAGRYQRVAAVEGRAVAHEYDSTLHPGALGVWLTHEKLLRAHPAPDRHLHVIEDDTVFCRDAPDLFAKTLRTADALPGPWDLLFTDVYVPAAPHAFRAFAAKVADHARGGGFALLDLAPFHFACLNSMFVNKASVPKYARYVTGNWRVGVPLDIFLRRLVQERHLTAYVTVPFLTSISAESDESDILGSLGASRRVSDLYRRGFFVDADRRALLEATTALTAGALVSPLAALYLHGVRYALSDKWVPF